MLVAGMRVRLFEPYNQSQKEAIRGRLTSPVPGIDRVGSKAKFSEFAGDTLESAGGPSPASACSQGVEGCGWSKFCGGFCKCFRQVGAGIGRSCSEVGRLRLQKLVFKEFKQVNSGPSLFNFIFFFKYYYYEALFLSPQVA